MKVRVGDTFVDVKEYGCRMMDVQPFRIDPCVNIFVRVTDGCICACPFCSNAGAVPPRRPFDVGRLLEFSSMLADAGVTVNRVNVTGGEPALVSDLVGKILDGYSSPAFSEIHLHLNTNGVLPSSMELMRNPRWNSVSVSLHHYDRERLSELYGFPVPEEAFRFDGVDMMKVNASCNLIRGYIDSPEEVRRMLDFALDIGLTRIGFVSLMKVNGWCRDHYVDFSELDFESIPRVHFTRTMDRGLDCKCSNYLYSRDLRVLEIYNRNYLNRNYCESSLVYDGEHFRQGFGKTAIVW